MKYQDKNDLIRAKERIEQTNSSFDFINQDFRALEKVNKEIKKTERRELLDQISRYTKPIAVLVALIVIGVMTYNHKPTTKAVIEQTQANINQVKPEPVSTTSPVAKPEQPEFIKELQKSEAYKQNEELAKKLATAHCGYKSSKQGDFYVCDFNSK